MIVPPATACPPQRFRLLVTAPAAGAWNMALDHALMQSVRQGGDPVLRFYRWSPPCLSLGRNQPARDRFDLEALHRRGIDVVRRPTGGRAVLHDRELTYAVVVEDRALGGPRRCYAAVNRALLAGVRRLGVDAELQGALAARAPAPSLEPCFHGPAEGELVVGGRKLIGSAQVREAGVLLQHGSLLLEGRQSTLLDLVHPGAGLATPSDEGDVTLADLLQPLPDWTTLVEALAAGWAEELACRLGPSEPTAAELDRASGLERRYRQAAWTWRC